MFVHSDIAAAWTPSRPRRGCTCTLRDKERSSCLQELKGAQLFRKRIRAEADVATQRGLT
jgi:hypothetical protein